MFSSHSVNSNVCRICQSNNQHVQQLERDDQGYFHSICRSAERRNPRIGELIQQMRVERSQPASVNRRSTQRDTVINLLRNPNLPLEVLRAAIECLSQNSDSSENLAGIRNQGQSHTNPQLRQRAEAFLNRFPAEIQAQIGQSLGIDIDYDRSRNSRNIANETQRQNNQIPPSNQSRLNYREGVQGIHLASNAARPSRTAQNPGSEIRLADYDTLEQERGISISGGHITHQIYTVDTPWYDFERSPKIMTQKGREYQDLVAFLDQKPKTHFVTVFDDSRFSRIAVDAAGLTRQLVSTAARQAFENPELFSMAGKDRYLDVQSKPDLKGYYELGLILGKVANLDMAVSTSLGDDFFASMLQGFKLNQTSAWKSMDIQSFEAHIVKQTSDQLKALLVSFNPSSYKKLVNRVYLNTFSTEALINKVGEEVLPYAALAKGFSKTSYLKYETIDALRGTIGGVVNLKADLKNTYQVNDPYRIKEFESVKSMIDDTMKQYSETELRSLCSTITGASSQVQGKKFDFKVIDDESLMLTDNTVFKPASCDKTMRFNVHAFKVLVKNMNGLPDINSVDFKSPGVKELFKSMLIGARGDDLNDR